MTATGTAPAWLPPPPRGATGAGRRRRRVLTEIAGAVLFCVVGFRLFADPVRRFEVGLSEHLLGMLGEGRISTVLGDAYLIFRPDGPPIVAHLTPSCSALGSFLALAALAAVGMRQRPQSLLGLALAVCWALLANQVRLVLSLLAGVHLGVKSLVLFHDWVGAVLNFCFILIGLLIMVSFTMHPPGRAEQDRSGRHTARRPLAWGRPGLGYRVEREDLPQAAGINLLGFVHRRLLPAPVSLWLAQHRERNRIDYRLGYLSPPERAAAVRALAGRGLSAHTATLLAVASFDADGAVLDALADAVAARQWEPMADPRVLALRLWARAWIMRRPIDHHHGHREFESARGRLVAVTGAGGPAGVAVIRALVAAGERVLALDADPDAAGLRLGCLSAVLPRADADGYDDALLAAVERHRPDALICTVAEEYPALGPLVGRLHRLGCRTWLPPAEAARTCSDKAAFAAALEDAEVPHPPTAATLEDAFDLPGPWIVKPRSGRGSRDVVTAETPDDLARAFELVPAPIAQTRVEGKEFTADVLVDRDGTLVTCVPRWRDDTRAGISVRGTTFDSSAVTRVVAATLEAVGLTGPANVQGFVENAPALDADPDAEVPVTVLEVNPRFSGGLPLTLAAGADVVGTYLAGIRSPRAALPDLTFTPGVRMVRHFTELYYGTDGQEVADPLTPHRSPGAQPGAAGPDAAATPDAADTPATAGTADGSPAAPAGDPAPATAAAGATDPATDPGTDPRTAPGTAPGAKPGAKAGKKAKKAGAKAGRAAGAARPAVPRPRVTSRTARQLVPVRGAVGWPEPAPTRPRRAPGLGWPEPGRPGGRRRGPSRPPGTGTPPGAARHLPDATPLLHVPPRREPALIPRQEPGPRRTSAAERVSRRVLVPFGTRPEVIKLAPVVRALRATGHQVVTVDTGQHTDAAMAADVQRALGLVPDVRLTLPDGPGRTGALLAGAVSTLAEHPADLVMALGDTHTVPSYALAARAAGVPFAHLEAGLRSFNDRSVEEVNRRVAASIAQLHFAPTARAADFLAAEGVAPERVFVVGNPVVDALKESGARPVPPTARSGVLVTAHRASNVDDPARLARLVTLVGTLAGQVGPVLFPLHPRTANRLREHGLADRLAGQPGVTLCDPLPYARLLAVLAASLVVVTDSGGLQEEAAYFGVPVVVLRRSTPRWEGVENGSAVLTGLTSDAEAADAARAAQRLSRPAELARVASLTCPYGDGTTGEQVAAILADPAVGPLLHLGEPDFTRGALPWKVTTR